MKCDPVNDKENDVSDLNAMNGKVNWARLVYEFEMPLGFVINLFNI